jgi:hypothetical protein
LWDADLGDDGLRLSRPRNPEVWVPVGRGTARYLGGNQLTVRVRGREITLTIVRNGTDQVRLARDVAAFLNNERDPLDPNAYRVRRLLYVASVAPLGATALALGLHVFTSGAGVFGWIMLGVGAALFALALLRRGAWSVRQRLIASAFPTVLAFAVVGIAYAAGLAPPPPVDARQWRTVTIVPTHRDDPPFKVAMPGEPVSAVEFYGWWGDLRVLHLPKNRLSFAAGTLPATVPDPARGTGDPVGNFYKMMPGANPVSDHTSRMLMAGVPVREMVFRIDGPRWKGVLAVRLCTIKGHTYFLAVAGTHLDPLKLNPDVRKFLDSFQEPQGDFPVRGGLNGEPPSPAELRGPLTHWSFDDDQPAALGDYNGDCRAEAGGVRGKGLHVSGKQDSYFEMNPGPGGLNFGAQQPFTFVGWFKTQRQEATLLSLRNSNNQNPLIELTLVNGGHLQVSVRDNSGGVQIALLSPNPVNDGDWHHFAFLRTGTGRVQFCVDGKWIGELARTNLNGPIPTNRWTLGRRVTEENPTAADTYEGWLDEVALFNRALTIDEIVKLARRTP